MHGCKEFVLPKSNLEYWLPKLTQKSPRRGKHHQAERNGLNVIVLWECEIKDLKMIDKELRAIMQLKGEFITEKQ